MNTSGQHEAGFVFLFSVNKQKTWNLSDTYAHILPNNYKKKYNCWSPKIVIGVTMIAN